jgi:hypothetical protein
MLKIDKVTGNIADSDAETYYVIYHDQYGGAWRTDAILASSSDDTNAVRLQDALRALPNEVLDAVTVTKRTIGTAYCTRSLDGQQHLPAEAGHGNTFENACASAGTLAKITPDAQAIELDISFANSPGQSGVQFLLQVVIDAQPDGSYPVSKGFTTSSTASVVEKYQAPETDAYGRSVDIISEAAECSDRGLANAETGLCECFDGFRGRACEVQEALA